MKQTHEVKRGAQIVISLGGMETEAVRIAAGNLKTDLEKVLDAKVMIRTEDAARELPAAGADLQIRIHTAGVQAGYEWLEKLLPVKDGSEQPEQKGSLCREGFLRTVREGVLYLAGADRRGTIYAIYDFCQWMGVSPWYFWADVPVRARKKLVLEEGSLFADYPSVEYRGVFINDEEELEKWVKLHMGEETIGVKTYEKIFELLRRLKGNYIWPAMHVNSFNLKRENGELADRMGIIAGTSHCDMLMRSNHREWRPWLEKKGYRDVEYDYSLPGRNREILEEYWRESVVQNRDFEVSYTLGMRGIHDSGFETRSLAGLSGRELIQAKTKLLEEVIGAQQRILADTLKEGTYGDTLKIFVPYKEVLELYDNGLQVPEELTLIWANDNYGYIRRYPNERERRRKGGNGIYYHNSYWAPPGGSYLFICSIPLAHTRNELYKAWQEGIRKVWVMNIGALKPLEQEIEFYLRFAWEVGKKGALTQNVDAYLEWWINTTFTGNHGAEMADVLNTFSQLTNVRKIEQMDTDTFSQTAYGDEASARMERYHELFVRAGRVYEALPEEEKAAFFQMCLMKIHAAYFTNAMYYYGDRSAICAKQGKIQAAELYTRYCREFDDARRRLLLYYGKEMSGGKWEGILTPEDYPPPRTAMYPACVPPLGSCEKKLLADCWNEEREITFVKPGRKWIQLANAGKGNLAYRAEAPWWLELSETEGVVGAEKRILVQVKPELWQEAVRKDGTQSGTGEPSLEGKLQIFCAETAQCIAIPVKAELSHGQEAHLEDGGMVWAAAEDAENGTAGVFRGWKQIPRLGRGEGSLMEAREEDAELQYSFYVEHEGKFLLELHRFPSLDSVGRIRIGCAVDHGERLLIESQSTDEWRGSWKQNVRDNVDRLTLRLPYLERGRHTLSFYAIDPYFGFSRWVIYTKPAKYNMLGGPEGGQQLPEYEDPGENAFYGRLPLGPRPQIYAPVEVSGDAMAMEDILVEEKEYAAPVTPRVLLDKGKSLFKEKDGIRIDAAAALAQSEFACTAGYSWDYCASESYGRSGLALHIRKPGLTFSGSVPTLNYRFVCAGGEYRIWLLFKCNEWEDARFTVGIDGEPVPAEKLWGGRGIWRFCSEQAYRWVPVWQQAIAPGEHMLRIYVFASGARFDRIYLTRGEELPPADGKWC